MRRAFALASLASALVFACSSFGTSSGDDGPTAPTPDASFEGGSVLDGGTNDAPSALPKRCADAGLLFCDDFEQGLGKWTKEATDGGLVEIVAAPKRSGNALHARVEASTTAIDAILRQTISVTNFHVRFWAYLDAPLPATSIYPVVSLTKIQIELRETNTLLVNQFADPKFFGRAPDAVPIDKWFCVEWKVFSLETTLRVDGTAQIQWTDGGVNSSTTRVDLGLSRTNANTAAAQIWIDDIAIGNAEIGCD
jgi:hypothetical protein